MAVTSNFSVDGEGWTGLGDFSGFSHQPAGGNDGGYLQLVDAATGSDVYFNAPAKFLGDRSSYYGGSLSYDLKLGASANYDGTTDIVLTGGGLTIVVDTTVPTTDWTHYVVTLDTTGGWTVGAGGPAATRAQIEQVLADVDSLAILGEFLVGVETTGLDNVVLAETRGPYVFTITPGGRTWTQAQALAVSLGGHLASITSAAENDFVLSVLAEHPDLQTFDPHYSADAGPWIGLRQAAGSPEPAGGWGWVNGETYAYTAWNTGSGEPNNFPPGEAFGLFWADGGGLGWNDYVDDPTTVGSAVVTSAAVELASGAVVVNGTNNVDYIYGDGAANIIYGRGGNDGLSGGDGADTLDGGAGNDQMFGGDGNDGFRATAGADLFDGGAGVDGVNFGPASSSVIFLDGSGTNAGGASGDTFVGIENINGSATGPDFIVGDGADNRFTGNGGNDTLNGRAGADQLDGGAGADRLIGEAGNDVLVGGADADRFVFNLAPATGGLDRTADFQAGVDKIEVDASLFGGGLVAGGAVQLVANAAPSSAGIVGGVFLYDTDSGFLSWDADGQGAGAAVAFFRLQNLPALTAADFVVVA